jgi:peptidoglycan/LPS O-acetylase OafA/YrhL
LNAGANGPEPTPRNVTGCPMDLRRATALFAIAVGAMMFAQWAFFLGAGEVTELDTEPIRISFHLAAEFLTAAALVVAGVGLTKGKTWAFPALMLALGMLSYTIVVSPGYFAQDGEYIFVAMFAVLWILTLALIFIAVKRESELREPVDQKNRPET